MTTYNHIHLPCCDNSCVLITSEITASGTQTTIHPSRQICETLFGQPNTCWTVYPIKTTLRSTEGKSVDRPLVSLLTGSADPPERVGEKRTTAVTLEAKVVNTIATQTPQISARTVPIQTDPVVILDTGVGRPPALFSGERVSFFPFSNLYLYYVYHFPGVLGRPCGCGGDGCSPGRVLPFIKIGGK